MIRTPAFTQMGTPIIQPGYRRLIAWRGLAVLALMVGLDIARRLG